MIELKFFLAIMGRSHSNVTPIHSCTPHLLRCHKKCPFFLFMHVQERLEFKTWTKKD